ncbi:MAG: carbohydrate-binding protein [Kiritimatiellae bacterium]|nr:carbohydrate-binding protein [Kiritimatiellia bacterium]
MAVIDNCMRACVLSLVFALTGALEAHAAEYFVSPSGCDGADGSSTKPWRTIQHAADVAVAGDVVTIRGGTYREWVKPANAGRKGAPITYRAADGEKVVVTGADPVKGWTKRHDGLWTVRLDYDSFGGMNPFTDFIYGDWFGAREKCFRTRLVQDGKPLVLKDRSFLLGHCGMANRALVNIAGLTSGGRTVPGDSAVSKSPNVKPGFPTKWGMELGWIYDNSTIVYKGFDFSTPAARELSIHMSSAVYNSRIDICDAAKPEMALASVRPPITGDWKKYTTVTVTLPETAAGVKDILLRFHEVDAVGRSPSLAGLLGKGRAVMIPGMVYGTIIAAFEKDPNVSVPELIVRPACFYPTREFRDYITLRGILFMNAGPNWAPPTSEQTAIVGTNWSKGWIIEDCEVFGTECSGITLGKYGDEFDNVGPTAQNYHNTIMRCASNGLERVGHHMVRRCRITDCGQAGICGSLGAVFSTVEDCEISYCHWNKPYGGAEMAGIKIHAAVDFTVARCRIHHCGELGGLWFDWMAQGARIVGNKLWANKRDIFFEVDHGPNLVEGNDFLSDISVMAYSQGVAFVGNRIRGRYSYHNDKRRTPIFKPHSVTLVSLDEVECGQGAFVFINNILGNDPRYAKEAHPSRYEDNWMIPASAWKVDVGTGECSITPPADSKRPEFKPVDAKRLGRPPFVDQAYPEPSNLPLPSVAAR